MAIITGADDDKARLGGVAKLRRVGSGAAVVGTDKQAAVWQERKQLLLAVSFEVAGKADGVTGKPKDGGEAGFVVGGDDVWIVSRGLGTLKEMDFEILQVQGIIMAGDGDRDIELLEAVDQAAGFESR